MTSHGYYRLCNNNLTAYRAVWTCCKSGCCTGSRYCLIGYCLSFGVNRIVFRVVINIAHFAGLMDTAFISLVAVNRTACKCRWFILAYVLLPDYCALVAVKEICYLAACKLVCGDAKSIRDWVTFVISDCSAFIYIFIEIAVLDITVIVRWAYCAIFFCTAYRAGVIAVFDCTIAVCTANAAGCIFCACYCAGIIAVFDNGTSTVVVIVTGDTAGNVCASYITGVVAVYYCGNAIFVFGRVYTADAAYTFSAADRTAVVAIWDSDNVARGIVGWDTADTSDLVCTVYLTCVIAVWNSINVTSDYTACRIGFTDYSACVIAACDGTVAKSADTADWTVAAQVRINNAYIFNCTVASQIAE